MPNKKFSPFMITGLLSALMSISADATMLKVEPREGESLEDAIARTEAEHRAECAECRAEHEARQAQASNGEAKTASQDMAKGTDPSLVGEMREKLYAKHKDELNLLDKKHAEERAQLSKNLGADTRQASASSAFSAPYGEQPKRNPLGYMAFAMNGDKMEPISGSFDADREHVEKKLAEFNNAPSIKLLIAVGIMTPAEVRPVFAD